MAIEPRRGCGYRKIGGLYLVSDGPGVVCDRLPIPLTTCPVCSHGFKQSRGWTWVDVAGLTGGLHQGCADDFSCPLCMDTTGMGRAGLLWIGERFYKTPAAFIEEGRALGLSRRITAIPRGFKLGETWVLLAHPKCWVPDGCCHKPAMFYVWRPQRIEKILPESQRGSEEVAELEKRGITPVFVPDDDRDHQGTVYDDEDQTTLPLRRIK